MRVRTGHNSFRRPPPRAVVTIGMFDGVHVAHQQLIRTTLQLAARLRGTSLAITFDPDPQWILDPAHAQPPLMPLARRLHLMRALGLDLIWVIPFTRAFSAVTPEQFVQRILLRRLQTASVVVGDNFAFGNARRGTLELLRAMGRACSMRVVALPAVVRDGAAVSSSRIRRLVQAGDLNAARRLLGRPVELSGTVVSGEGRARRLGFPTANVRLTPTVLPPRGVYRVWLEHRGRRIPGVMNLGIRPTFGGGPLVCEIHLIGFRGDLYGRPVTIACLQRLRAERRFPNPQALIQQIQRDLRQARLAPLPTS